MNKIFFFDVDGTLVNDDRCVPEKHAKALQELKRRGYKVCLATGRSVKQCLSVIEETNIEFDYLITNNGQEILTGDFELLESGKLSNDVILKLNNFVRENGGLLLPRNKDMIGAICTKEELIEAGKWLERDVWMADLSRYTFISVEDIEKYDFPLVVTLTKPEVNEKLIKLFGDDLEVFKFENNACDIYTKGTSKATAIKYVLNLLNGDYETFAFGDSWNDVEMMKLVDNPIVMGNAVNSDVIKETQEIIKSNNESGIYYYLKEKEII